MDMKPVMYLDVDDTLVRHPDDPYQEDIIEFYNANPDGGPPNNVKEFLEFAQEHFEVRWLTFWCPNGTMEESRKDDLANILAVPRSLIENIRNPMGFMGARQPSGLFTATLKTNAIDWDEYEAGREFVWVEDDMMQPMEFQILRGYKARDNYICCNVSKNPNRLNEVMQILKERYKL